MHEPLRTLIVEDSEDDALLVVRELQRGGHAVAWERVETAEAMRAALQEQNWDIVIADYCLPQFDAPSALALVQQSGLDLPFIVVSGTVGEDLAVTMMRQGVHDYFTKDSLSRLAPAVERELREAKERHRLRAAEQKLRQSEERYRRLVESAAEAIFVVDENGRFLSANRQAALDMGTTPEALVEKTLYDCFPQGLADQHVAAIRSVFRSGAPLFGRESLTPTAYGDRWYCTTLAPVTDEDGDVTCVLGIARDVTERRRAEDALRASEERYRSVVDNIAVGVAVISPEMEILGLNEEMQRRFPHIDTSRRPLCHRSLYDPPRESVCSYCPTSKTFQDGQVHEAVAVRGKGAEARYYRILASPLRDASGEVIAAIEMVEDITDRKRADDAMLRVSKLDSLALLAGGIAHDFNNVLTGIMGNVSLAKMHAGSDRTVGRALERAQKACRQATHLTHQLLTFAKGGAPVRAPASLPEVVEDSARFALQGSNARCELLLADGLWPAEVDEAQISQAISNLVINADQAMPDGGAITVRAENVPVGVEESPPLGDGRYVKVTVQDEGIGIRADHLDKVFDPYFTTKQKGSGLGLATTHSIVERHGGAMAVESEQGVGTAFHLYLPAADRPAPTRAHGDGEPIAGTGRILVMDDEEMVRDVAARMLTHLGYQVECAAGGTEAIDIYRQAMESEQPFDAVIMDLTVPGAMGGREAVRELVKIDPEAKVIASSGYSTDPVMANRAEYGFCAVAPKPYRTDELAQIVHDVLAGSGGKVCTAQ